MSRVTAVVVSHESAGHLGTCLDALACQDEGLGIVVVDNGSADAGAELAGAHPSRPRVVRNGTNVGFAAAVNQGIALADGELVLVVNPDARLRRDALPRLVACLDERPRAAAAGPRQWIDDAESWQWSIVPHPPHWSYLVRLGRHRLAACWALNRAIWRSEDPRRVPLLSGACLLLRRTALADVGGFDDGYFLFFEDADLGRRLDAAGWELWAVPSAGAVHSVMGSVARLPRRGEDHLLESGRRYLARHGDLLTRILWTVATRRRSRRADTPEAARSAQLPAPRALSWRPVDGASGYWIELATQADFLYAAASAVCEARCSLPEELRARLTGRRLFARRAPVDARGRLGIFEPVSLPEHAEP